VDLAPSGAGPASGDRVSDAEPSGLDPEAAIRRLAEDPAQPDLEPDGGAFAFERGDRPPRPPRPPAPIIDTRPYQRMIGAFGLVLVLAFSLFLFLRGGNGTPGIAVGQRLHRFVAPLATSDIDASANGHPVCDRARPARRGLNVCGRAPTVLAFFTVGQKGCVQQVDAMQAISGEFPHIRFGAVAIGASHSATAKLVAQHHWTIPVAYDSADVVGQIYGVEVCPLAEVGTREDRVAALLIGKYWASADHLAAEVKKLKLAP
jgi:hypothetical protein